MPRAWVVPLSAPPASYTAAVERSLTGAGIAKSSSRIYRISLTTWGWMFAGEAAPTGRARRGAKPPIFPVAAIDDPVLPDVLAELAAARADEMDADTVNRELSIVRKALGWWQRQGWIEGDPTIGIERRPVPPDRTKALAENQIAALWRLDVALREKTFWKMLYESAARADEVLCLNVEDLYPQDKRGKITAKGGATEWIHLPSGTPSSCPPDRPPHPRPPVPHRLQGPGRDTDAGHVPGDRPGEALLPAGRGDLRGVHPVAGQPAGLAR
ncbi:hypothetical protein [Streptomyces sp. P17]|uniref:hypothetical protein n=1 Tax=Streptomyces sp. P17 TaxID=3074716 RepID=UPI0028F3EDC5|nr:hypothetical protein [Streptomyces sp. P17]MDT9697947.1 hypothetical protein [Streptomyces sp. P17]